MINLFKDKYSVSLLMAGVKYEDTGKDIDEAIAKLGLSWEQIKAKGVVTVSRGGQSYEHLFYPRQLRRIFANKLTRFMWAKRLALFLKETAGANE